LDTDVPRHPERQFMQHLRAGGWLKAATLPSGPKLIESLLNKGLPLRTDIAGSVCQARKSCFCSHASGGHGHIFYQWSGGFSGFFPRFGRAVLSHRKRQCALTP
jgi:hypothetical protein